LKRRQKPPKKFDRVHSSYVRQKGKMTFIVFIDSLSGLTQIPKCSCESLEEALNNIEHVPNQKCFFHIYESHFEKVPIFAAKVRVDVFKYVRTVGGASVMTHTRREGLQYAVTDWENHWFFADKLFGT
jgi:hypothetical protein